MQGSCEMKPLISFEKNAKLEILDALNKAIDSEGYIIEKNKPNQRVFATDGDCIEVQDLAAITSGSLEFVKNDIDSLIKLADKVSK